MQTSGPEGGPVFAVCSDGERVYAGTLGGAYGFDEGEGRWFRLAGGGPTTAAISAVACSGDSLFLGTGEGRVFFSEKGTLRWRELGAGLANGLFVTSLAVVDTFVFASSLDGVFLWSPATGQWERRTSGLICTSIDALAARDSTLYAMSCGVFMSRDRGQSWALVGQELSIVKALITHRNRMFVAVKGDGVFVLHEDSMMWMPVNSGLTNLEVEALGSLGETLYAGTSGGGIFKSVDIGQTWSEANVGISGLGLWVDAFASLGDTMFAGTQDGVYLSTDDGASWRSLRAGLVATSTGDLAVKDERLFAGTTRGADVTSDGGASWRPLDAGLGIYGLLVNDLTCLDDQLYIGTSGGGVFVLNEDETGWTPANNGLGNLIVGALFTFEGTLFAGTEGIYISRDFGASWDPADVGSQEISVLSFLSKDSLIFAGTHGDGLFLSSDKGASWRRVSSNLPSFTVIRSLASVGERVIAGTDRGIYISDEDGRNMTLADSSTEGLHVFDLVVFESDLFAGTGDGVYVSKDRGETWRAVNAGFFPNTRVLSFAIYENKLFAGTSRRGMWVNPTLITHVESRSPESPDDFSLLPNYPNPFNESTRVRFTLPARMVVTLELFDVLGRKVRTLVEGEFGAGAHEVLFEARGLASGVYWVRLQTRRSAHQRKVLLLR